jgi:hypothetical protein
LEVGAAESSEAKVREANFNETLLKHGIERIVNRVEEDPRRPPLPRVPPRETMAGRTFTRTNIRDEDV